MTSVVQTPPTLSSSTITDTPRLVHIDSHIKYNASKLNANRNDVHLDNYLNSFKYVHNFRNNCIHDIICFYKTVILHAILALRYFIKEALIFKTRQRQFNYRTEDGCSQKP